MEGKSAPKRRSTKKQVQNPRNYNFGQNSPQNFPQNFIPNSPQNFISNFPQTFNPNLPQNFNPNSSQNFSQNPFVTPQGQYFPQMYCTSQNDGFISPIYTPSAVNDYGSGSGTPRAGESIDQNEVDEEEEEEEEEIAEDVEAGDDFFCTQTFTPMASAQPVHAHNKLAWASEETETLITAYMSISHDGIVGTSQKKSAFWAKVVAKYEEIRATSPGDMPYRSPSMLRSKWMRLARSIMKWVACYDEAAARRKSGHSRDDTMREAQIIHMNTHKSKFTILSEWRLLERYPKWQPLVLNSLDKSFIRGRPTVKTSGSESSGKRARDINDDEFDDILETPHTVRPEGIKRAKARVAGKNKNVVSDVVQAFTEKMQLLNDRSVVDAEAAQKRLEYLAQKEARKKKQIELEEKKTNWEMLQVLQNKPQREPFEEEMYEDIVNYFKNITKR